MGSSGERIFLSSPAATQEDLDAVVAAMQSGWLAPVGPEIGRFEDAVSTYVGTSYGVALSSGTAALHLILRWLGVGPGDFVLVPTMTFAATAFPVTYVGATPVFVDVDPWGNLSAERVDQALSELRAEGAHVGAVIAVDLYGATANYEELVPLVEEYGVPLIEDAAEALGATCLNRRAGSFGVASAVSFNGNKIITTSGGGMVLTGDRGCADKIKFWSTQARDIAPWYQHSEVGHNYRMSNLLAALGNSQMSRLTDIIATRRSIRDRYRERLGLVPGIVVLDDPPWGQGNAWLTVVRFAPDTYRDGPRRVRKFLETHDIETRPVWKPLHQQPLYAESRNFLDGSADSFFEEGLCLPSGSMMKMSDVDRVSDLVLRAL